MSDQVVRHAPVPPSSSSAPARSRTTITPLPTVRPDFVTRQSPAWFVAVPVGALGEGGARRGGVRAEAGWPMGTSAIGQTCSGRPRIACISARNPVVIVVSALPSRGRSPRGAGSGPPGRSTTGSSPRGRAARRRTRRCSPARRRRRRSRRGRRRRASRVSAGSPRTRAVHSPPVARDRRSARGYRGVRARPRTPTAACSRRSARTSPAVRMRAIVSSSTGSVENDRHARWRATTSKKESLIVHGASLAPTRANELTYMMRRLGPRAQCLNASVRSSPMRCITSGVIDLNAVSGSSVSIS